MLWHGLIVCSSLLVLHTAASTPRRLAAYPDPYCDGTGSRCGLCYVRAEGSRDTLHHLWSPRGAPTIVTVSTAPQGRLTGVDWVKIRNHEFNSSAFNFSEPGQLAYALILTKVWEAAASGKEVHPAVNLTKLEWAGLTGCYGNSTSVTAVFTANDTSQPGDKDYFTHGGVVRLTMVASSDWTYGSGPPGLLRGPDNAEMQLELVKLGENITQWGVEMTLVGSRDGTEQPQLRTEYTLDDYHAPGVFKHMELLSAKQYASWRPISYGDAAHSLTQSSGTKNGEPKPGGDAWQLSDVLSAWVAQGAEPWSTSLPVTLGASKGYVSWSTTVGQGAPPGDGPSVALIGAFAAGAALLVLAAAALLLLFVPVSCCRRSQDDERLLVA